MVRVARRRATLAARARAALAIQPLMAIVASMIVGTSTVALSRPPERPTPTVLVARQRPLRARRVILYGDSLAWEAQDAFRTALARAGVGDVTTETFGGTAICDWLPSMGRDQVRLHPDTVVVEFSGNALTPCMSDVNGTSLSGQAYFEKYRHDAQAVLKIFASDNTLVYFAGAPINRQSEQAHDPRWARLNQIYLAAAASDAHARYLDAGAAVTDHGHWTETLPCLLEEPCTGGIDSLGEMVNIVRASDGTHFCPTAPAAVRGVTTRCPVWSSGAYRYGTAMATAVARLNPSAENRSSVDGVVDGAHPAFAAVALSQPTVG